VLLLRLTIGTSDLLPDILLSPRDFEVFPSSTKLVALLKVP